MQETRQGEANTGYILVLCTSGSRDEAQKIAGLLVAERAAAGVSVSSPVISTFHWQGRVHKEEEVVCFIRTTRKLYPVVEKIILENHGYEVPEIIAVPITAGHKDYLRWISANTMHEVYDE